MKMTKSTFLEQNSGGLGGQANFSGSEGDHPSPSYLGKPWSVRKDLTHFNYNASMNTRES